MRARKVYQMNAVANLGTKLREARIAKEMSGPQVAQLAGITRAYLWQIEAGDANPNWVLAQRLAAVVGLEIVLKPRKDAP